MYNLSKTSKIFLFLSVLSGSLWMGGYFARLTISYQLFEQEDFILKPFFNESNLHAVLLNLGSIILLTLILYLLFIITYFIFIVSSKLSLKKNGWLFIVTLIIAVTFPFELYLISIDYKFLTSVYSGSFNSLGLIELIVDRFKVLGSFSVIELFSYFSIVYFILFKPLTVNS